MPPGINISKIMGDPFSGQTLSPASNERKSKSKLLDMPMPPMGSEDEDSLGAKTGKRKRKPKVIGKLPPATVCEVGNEWGERCIDIYEIVDKVGEGTYGEVFKSVLKSELATAPGNSIQVHLTFYFEIII